jgi:hypothetical protein
MIVFQFWYKNSTSGQDWTPVLIQQKKFHGAYTRQKLERPTVE